MKKYLLLFAVAVMSIACASVEDKAKEKLDKIFAEYNKGNYGEGDRLTDEYNRWYYSLDAEDQAKADIVAAPYNFAVDVYNYANGYDDYYCY